MVWAELPHSGAGSPQILVRKASVNHEIEENSFRPTLRTLKTSAIKQLNKSSGQRGLLQGGGSTQDWNLPQPVRVELFMGRHVFLRVGMSPPSDQQAQETAPRAEHRLPWLGPRFQP